MFVYLVLKWGWLLLRKKTVSDVQGFPPETTANWMLIIIMMMAMGREKKRFMRNEWSSIEV